MVRRVVTKGFALLERLVLLCAYQYFARIKRRGMERDISWVVGPLEIASMIRQLSGVIPRSYSVSFGTSAFYQNVHYDRSLPGSLNRKTGPIGTLRRALYGPLALAELSTRARGFIYVGPTGFLRFTQDERAYELKFLKNHGIRIGFYWCGSDIRSPTLMQQLETQTGSPNIFSYIGMISPAMLSAAHESVVKRRAELSDLYADIVFDFPMDQKNYITKHTEPFYYFMSDEQFDGVEEKFATIDRIVVSHAASSPIIKGTQLVRSAIARLRAEGYDFDYVEMLNFSNEQVLSQLRRSHIALNQFYGFTPAVFGCEALAARCAVMQSADGISEPRIPPHASDAWVVTRHYEVYQNLKTLLDDPELIRRQADRGQEWARKYCSVAETGQILNQLLDSVLDGSYDAAERAKDPDSAYVLQERS